MFLCVPIHQAKDFAFTQEHLYTYWFAHFFFSCEPCYAYTCLIFQQIGDMDVQVGQEFEVLYNSGVLESGHYLQQRGGCKSKNRVYSILAPPPPNSRAQFACTENFCPPLFAQPLAVNTNRSLKMCEETNSPVLHTYCCMAGNKPPALWFPAVS